MITHILYLSVIIALVAIIMTIRGKLIKSMQPQTAVPELTTEETMLFDQIESLILRADTLQYGTCDKFVYFGQKFIYTHYAEYNLDFNKCSHEEPTFTVQETGATVPISWDMANKLRVIIGSEMRRRLYENILNNELSREQP